MPRFGISFEGYIELDVENEEIAELEALHYIDPNDCTITSIELLKGS